MYHICMVFGSDKRRRKSIRLKGHNYSQPGYYFVTICSKDREWLFWEENDVGAALAPAPQGTNISSRKKIKLSIAGKIIENQIYNLQEKYPNVFVYEYVVMPIHIHIIFHLKKGVEASATPTIPQIIRSLKSKSTNEYCQYLDKMKHDYSGKIWQRNYYERIIRNEKELFKFRQYIQNNPTTWHEDENNPLNYIDF